MLSYNLYFCIIKGWFSTSEQRATRYEVVTRKSILCVAFCINKVVYYTYVNNDSSHIFSDDSSLKLNSPFPKKKCFYFSQSPLKVIKNPFYFMKKTVFVLEMLIFLSWLFNYVEKQFDEKAVVDFKIYDITD